MHMTATRMTAPALRRPRNLLWLVVLITTAAAAMLMLPSRNTALTVSNPPATPEAARVSPAPDATPTAIADAQVRAHQAALATTALPTGTTFAERPDYVSEMEWQILKGVTANSADPQRELDRLVAKLRFSRQRELWQGLPPQNAQRHALAQRLLADIPARVSNRDLDLHEARDLQQQLLDASIADPEERTTRLDAERQRLRVLITPYEHTP